MINGAHIIIYTDNAEADKAFFRDVLKLTNVDVGQGWLIFGLPASEAAFHPADGNTGTHELYLMTENVHTFIEAMKEKGVACTTPQDQGWGIITQLSLPGGGKLGVYQPRHARPAAI
jgi:catechol 2,3-dioxygenase-like lactoylglutathione lyase family enzyme